MTVSTAELCRDSWGVPHVRAGDLRSAYAGVGYAHAEDQLELMLRRYLSLRAEEGAVFGGDAVERDFERLRWGHLDEARAALPTMTPDAQDALGGFIDGVRRYMDTHPDRVPDWAPPLEPALPLAVYRAFLWSYMVGDALQSIAAANVTLSSDVVAELQAALPGPSASNVWFLAPDRTADGVSVLLSDPHGSIEHFPMFEVHLTIPGLALSGFAAVGAAALILGHNRDVAWGMTTGAPRVSDAYAFDRRRVQVHEDTVRGRVFQSVVHNGVRCPVVAERGELVYVACTPYQHDGGGIDTVLFGLAASSTVKEARAACSGLGMFPQNLMVADRAGGCWYIRAGRTPRRASHVDYSLPIDGHDEKAQWQGIHALDDLVQIDGAPPGYLQNCNVAPDTMYAGADESSLASSHYPPYLFNTEPGMTHSRGVRANELLSACTEASMDDLLAIATDEYWVGTEMWLAALRRALDGDDATDLRELLAFDGVAAPDSKAALVYSLWRERVVELTDAIDNDEDLTAQQRDALVAAARAAIADAGDARYGDRFRIRRAERSWPGRAGYFARKPQVVVNGDIVAPLRVMMFGPPDADGTRWEQGGGRSLRLTVLGERTQSWAVNLYGQSGDAASPHYDDQIALYSERKVRDTRFDDPWVWERGNVTTVEVTT